MKEKSDQISCPICKTIVFKRGLFGHLRFGHGKTPEEAHEIMSSPHESLHEKIPEEVEAQENVEVQEEIEEKLEEKEPSGLIPLIFVIGGMALMFLSRDPRFKEIADKLWDKLKALGSKKSSGSKSVSSWGSGYPPPGF